MRLLHIARDYYPDASGVAEVVYQLTTGLARRGHEVWVATGLPTNSSRGSEAAGVHVRRFALSGNSSIGTRGDPADYLNFILAGQWDAITVHSLIGWPIELLLPHLQKLSCAKVVVSHSDSLLHRPGFEAYRRQLGHALADVDQIVILSQSLVDRGFYDEFRLRHPIVIPNGVELTSWAAAPLGVRTFWGIGSRPWLITVGNHSGVKRHDRFFKVVTCVRAAVPGAIGTVIGHHHPAERFGLGRLGIRGGCWYKCRVAALTSKAVTLRAGLPRTHVVSAIKEADVLLLSSESEASPLVILEGMAAGTPWVSLDVGCVREHTGGLVVNSCREMADAAICLLNDARHRGRLGAEGRSTVKVRHDWAQIVTAYEQLYRGLVVSPHPST